MESFAALSALSGKRVPCAANLPLEMDDPARVWLVERGEVEIFLREHADEVEISALQHALTARRGRLIFGMAPNREDASSLSLIGKGLPGTMLRELHRDDLANIDPARLAEQADAWLSDITALLARDVKPLPQPDLTLQPGQSERGTGLVSVRGRAAWVAGPKSGEALYMGLADLDETTVPIPLTSSAWLTLTAETQLAAVSSELLAREGTLLPALAHFHDMALSLEMINRRLATVDLANLDRKQLGARHADGENARRDLFNLYNLESDIGAKTGPDGLFEAIRLIGGRERIEFKFPRLVENKSSAEIVNEVADLSGVRVRQVKLAPEQRWWRGAGESMLAFRAADRRPLVLTPGRLSNLRALDPDSGEKSRVTAAFAATLGARAWIFYRPLPQRSAGLGDLLRSGTGGLGADALRFLLAGLAIGLSSLLPALVAGAVVELALPANDVGLLWLAAGALVGVALFQALLQAAQGMAQMRLEGRAISRMEAAFWDRLLRLPLEFLQRFPAGDINMRGMVFRILRDNVLGAVAGAIVSVVFVLPIFALILRYQEDTALSLSTFGGIGTVLLLAICLRQIEPQHRVYAMKRSLSGLMQQFIKSIPRLRTNNAEQSAYATWARDFLAQMRAELEVGKLQAHLQAMQAALPMLPGVVLMLAVPLSAENRVTVGGFIVVYLLFNAFIMAWSKLSAVFGQLSTLKPSLDLIRPFLVQAPESTAERQPVVELGGEIAIEHVSFRYENDGPLILDDVSMAFRPGELVAITGASGSGKSTIFQLLLGLAEPHAGNVYYDGRDLRHLNLKQLRRHLGVVPQDSQVYPQDIWDNIAGDHIEVREDEVERALELADISNEVAAMPMGVFTFVGARTISGGELQRVSIARALLRNPRIILLDEATNALGNESQARVMRNLERMSSTRIVIAHRLSTLREADRIYVLDSGKVVQQGNFEELIKSGGLFGDLVSRQTT